VGSRRVSFFSDTKKGNQRVVSFANEWFDVEACVVYPESAKLLLGLTIACSAGTTVAGAPSERPGAIGASKPSPPPRPRAAVSDVAVKPSAPATPSPPAAPSPPICATGLPDNVFANCSCNPIEAEIERRLQETNLRELVQKTSKTCMRGVLSGNAADGEYYTTCVEKVQVIDPTIKDQLIKLVADASKGTLAKQGQLDTYLQCYRKWLFASEYDKVIDDKRAMAQAFSAPLLKTFMCNWMRVGVDMANHGCGSAANPTSSKRRTRPTLGASSVRKARACVTD